MKEWKKIGGNPFQSLTAEDDIRKGLLEIDMFYLTRVRKELKEYLEDVVTGTSTDLFATLEGAYGCGKTATIDTFRKWINEDLEIADNKGEKLRLNFDEKKCYAIKIELEKSFTLNKVIQETVDQITELMKNEGIDTTDMRIKLTAKDMDKSEDQIKEDLKHPEKKDYVEKALKHFENVNEGNFVDYINLSLQILKERISNFGKLFIFIDEGELATLLASGKGISKETEASMKMVMRTLPKKQLEEEILSHSFIMFSFAEITRELLERIDPELFGPKGRNPKKILIGEIEEGEFREFSKFVIRKRLKKWKEKHGLSNDRDFYPIKEELVEKIAYDPSRIFMRKKNIRTVIGIFKSLWDIWKKTKEDVKYLDKSLFLSSFERILGDLSVSEGMERKFDVKFKTNIKKRIDKEDEDEIIRNTAYNLFEILIGGFVFGAIKKEEFLSRSINGTYKIEALKDFDPSDSYHERQRERYINKAFDLLCTINKKLKESRDEEHIFSLENGSVRLNEGSINKIFTSPPSSISSFDRDKFISKLLNEYPIKVGPKKGNLNKFSVVEVIKKGLTINLPEKTRKTKKGIKNPIINTRTISDEKIEYVVCDRWVSDDYPQYKMIIVPRFSNKIRNYKNTKISKILLSNVGNLFSILVILCNEGIFVRGYHGKEETMRIDFLEKYGEDLHLTKEICIEDLYKLMLVKKDSVSEKDEHKDQKEDLIGKFNDYGKVFYQQIIGAKIRDAFKDEYKMFIIEDFLKDTKFDTLAKYTQNLTERKIKDCKEVFSEIMGEIKSGEISTRDEWEEFIDNNPDAAKTTYKNCKTLLEELNFVAYKRPGDEIESKFENCKGFKKVKTKVEKLFNEDKDELRRKEVYLQCLESKSTTTPRLLVDLYLEALKFSRQIDMEKDKIAKPKESLRRKIGELENELEEIKEELTTLSINGINIEILYDAYMSLGEIFEKIKNKRKSGEYSTPEALTALIKLQSESEIDLSISKEILSYEMKIYKIRNTNDLIEVIKSMGDQIKTRNEYSPNEEILRKISEMDTVLKDEGINVKGLGDFVSYLLSAINKDKKESLYKEKFYLISKKVNNLLCRIDELLDQFSEYGNTKGKIRDLNELIKKVNEVLKTKYDELQNCSLSNIDSFEQFIENKKEFQKKINRLHFCTTTIKEQIKDKKEWIKIHREIEKIKEINKEISDIKIDTKLALPQELKEKEKVEDLNILKKIKIKFDNKKEDMEKILDQMIKMCGILIKKSDYDGVLNELVMNAKHTQDKLRKNNLKIEEWEEWIDRFTSYQNLNEEYSIFEENVLKEKNVVKEMIKADEHAPSLKEVPPETYMEILQYKFKQEKKLKELCIEYREIEDKNERDKKLVAIIELICLGLLE
ncbi:MAG: hypothetical protein KAT49_00875 [Methanomicrobia archaeon]|nr:hypothetical protein [Methanomicrobia archaeon]